MQLVVDCNSGNRVITVDGSSLTIEVRSMTMATFPPESRSDQLFNLPGEAAMYFDEDGTLFVDLITDDGTLAFAPGNMETVETSEP